MNRDKHGSPTGGNEGNKELLSDGLGGGLRDDALEPGRVILLTVGVDAGERIIDALGKKRPVSVALKAYQYFGYQLLVGVVDK